MPRRTSECAVHQSRQEGSPVWLEELFLLSRRATMTLPLLRGRLSWRRQLRALPAKQFPDAEALRLRVVPVPRVGVVGAGGAEPNDPGASLMTAARPADANAMSQRLPLPSPSQTQASADHMSRPG
jgi:hypothetical protein